VVSREDPLDAKIIRLLNWSGREISERPTYWQISKEIGVNPKIISNRIEKMTEDGFINGIGIMINVSFLNLQRMGVFCELNRGIKPEEEATLGKLPFVFGVHTFNMEMNRIFIELVYDRKSSYEELLNKIEESFVGIRFLERFSCDSREIKLDRKTTSLIQILYENALMPVNEIARILEITSAKVKKLMKRITAQGGFRFITSVSGYRNFFVNVSEIFIRVDQKDKGNVLADIFRKVGSIVLYYITDFAGLIIICLNIENLSISREIIETIGKIDGIQGLEYFFPYKVQYYQPDIIKERIVEITGKEFGNMEETESFTIHMEEEEHS
jgi:DNA-binding Lrp family transcriptional regulator